MIFLKIVFCLFWYVQEGDIGYCVKMDLKYCAPSFTFFLRVFFS